MAMGNGSRHHPSLCYTLITQASLCISLYAAFYLGSSSHKSDNGTEMSRDLYFICVTGGHRHPKEQAHLLKQMEKVAKIYKAKFVVNISELGKEDPLFQNGTLHFPSLKVPWYTTGVSKGQGAGYFLKQISAGHEKFLNIIGVDTGLFHVQDSVQMDQLTDTGRDQLNWLMSTLEAADSRWRIVVGFHPLVVCEAQKKLRRTTNISESLHQIFLKYGVNAYLSKQGCCGNYTHNGAILYIGNLCYTNENGRLHSVEEGSSHSVEEGSSVFNREMQDGFLLHRVSSLEIVSYFINSASKVVFKSTLYQRGRAAI